MKYAGLAVYVDATCLAARLRETSRSRALSVTKRFRGRICIVWTQINRLSNGIVRYGYTVLMITTSVNQ